MVVPQRQAVRRHCLHTHDLCCTETPSLHKIVKEFSKMKKGLKASACWQVVVMEREAVRRHYLHTWFALDVAAACPLDLLFAGKRLDIWRLPRLLKVVRVLKYKSLAHAGVAVHWFLYCPEASQPAL